MTRTLRWWTLEVIDVDRRGAVWSQALGYTIERHSDDNVPLHAPDARRGSLDMSLRLTDRVRSVRNRSHRDLLVHDGDVDREAERLRHLDAKRRLFRRPHTS
jgi:hypothetical protein